jgi:hypothetical protein
MPACPRPKGKATKVAYGILGKPETLEKKSEKDMIRDKKLIFQEIARAR